MRHLARRAALYALPVLLLVVLGWPLLSILREAITRNGHLTLAVLREAAAADGLRTILTNTALVVLVSSIAATVLGVLLAILATKLRVRGAAAFRAVPLVPLTVAPLVGAIGWVFLLAPRTGWINLLLRRFTGGEEGPLDIFSLPGVIFVTTLYIVPYVFATMASALDRTGVDTFEAFLVNGASRPGAALRVVTGVLRPALLAGLMLAVLEAAIQFSIPLILNVHVLTTSIYEFAQQASPPRRDLAAAFGLWVLLFGAALTLLELMLLGRRRYTALAGRGLSRQGWSFGAGIDRALAMLGVLYLLVAAVLPLAAILLVSVLPYWKPEFSLSELTLRHYVRVYTSGNFVEAAGNSLELAAIGVTACVLIAFFISLLRTRLRSRLGQALYLIGNLPLGVPGVVLGLGALILFTTGPIPLYGTLTAMVLMYVVHHLPLALRNLGPVVQQIGQELEEAARVNGAGEFRVLKEVTVPLVLPGLAAAAAMVMILMLREFPISALLSTPQTKVLSVFLVNSFENGVFPQVAAMALGLSLVSLAGVLLLQALGARVRFGARQGRNHSNEEIPCPPTETSGAAA